MLGFMERLEREIDHNDMKVNAITDFLKGENFPKLSDEAQNGLLEEFKLRVKLGKVLRSRMETAVADYGDAESFDDVSK